jgi:N-acetylated-alpha-linked acidic dipeptidase
MGSGSDFTAFQDFAGIPSIDMGFKASLESPVYHYHSNYDSFAWMSKFGDPGFYYHAAISRMWALVALKIIETPIIRLNATDYALGLSGYLDRAKEKAANSTTFQEQLKTESEAWETKLFRPLDIAIENFYNASVIFDAAAADLASELANSDIPWWKWWERVKLWYRVRRVNLKYKLLERQLLYSKGLDGRNWFKHVVFAPGLWTGYAGATFPGIVESIAEDNIGNAHRWVGIITGLVNKATKSLEI